MDWDFPKTQKVASIMNEVANVGMQDFSRLAHICHYVLEAQKLEGDMVEFGCWRGYTAKLMSELSDKKLHVYDSFEGLPYDGDGGIKGEMSNASIELLTDLFLKDNVRLPEVYKGWFSDLEPEHIPEKIAFAHLDGDQYEGTLIPLKLIYDRLVPGAFVVIDDYKFPKWTGVDRAVSEFLADKPEKVLELSGMNGSPGYKAVFVKI
jgi:O-methyltransferase